MKYYRGVRHQKGQGIFTILLPLIASAVGLLHQWGYGWGKGGKVAAPLISLVVGGLLGGSPTS